MDQSSHWRDMFDKRKLGPTSEARQVERPPHAARAPSGSYDDGYTAPMAPASPGEIVDEATISLGADSAAYRPWILQRGRTRPAIMLHLRRFDARAGKWTGWAASYPHLAAVEYVGDTLITLDFGTRFFAIEGRDLGELIDHLQAGVVLCVQEFTPHVWPITTDGPFISAIRSIKADGDA